MASVIVGGCLWKKLMEELNENDPVKLAKMHRAERREMMRDSPLWAWVGHRQAKKRRKEYMTKYMRKRRAEERNRRR